MGETQAHHGVTVSNLEAMTVAVGAIGFTQIEGGATEPRNYRNEPGDAIGQMIAPTLGDEIRTWFIENPATRQQIDLVELTADATRLERPGDSPAQGDLTIGIATDDPDGAYQAMREAAPTLAWSEASPCPGGGRRGLHGRQPAVRAHAGRAVRVRALRAERIRDGVAVLQERARLPDQVPLRHRGPGTSAGRWRAAADGSSW